jgi:hypothetical protein
MDNNSVKSILENRITELREEKAFHLHAAGRCTAIIEELESLQVAVDKFCYDEKNKNIQASIKKNTLKDVLVEPDDAKRFNFFLLFKEKCGEETNFAKCRTKIGGKLEGVLYRKGRLWPSWKEFLTDYKSWQNREGRWDNITY